MAITEETTVGSVVCTSRPHSLLCLEVCERASLKKWKPKNTCVVQISQMSWSSFISVLFFVTFHFFLANLPEEYLRERL